MNASVSVLLLMGPSYHLLIKLDIWVYLMDRRLCKQSLNEAVGNFYKTANGILSK